MFRYRHIITVDHGSLVGICGEPLRIVAKTGLEDCKCIAGIACTVQSLSITEPNSALAIDDRISGDETTRGILLGNHLAVKDVVAHAEIPLLATSLINPCTTGIAYAWQLDKSLELEVAVGCRTHVNLILLAVTQSLVAPAGEKLALVLATQENCRGDVGRLLDVTIILNSKGSEDAGPHLCLKAKQTVNVSQHPALKFTLVAGNTRNHLCLTAHFAPLRIRNMAVITVDGIIQSVIKTTYAMILVHRKRTAILRVDVVVIMLCSIYILASQQIEVAQHNGDGEQALAAVANKMSATAAHVTIVVI